MSNPFLITLCLVLLILLILNWRLTIADRIYQKEKHQKNAIRHQKEIDVQRQELELLINTFDDALIVLDKDGVIRLANRAAIQLCKGREIKGKTAVQAFLNEPIAETLKRSIHTTEPFREKLILAGGSFGDNDDYDESAWILDAAPFIANGDDSLTRVILRDVTAEHKTDQIKREFVANASHELRTPLSIINGYVENLLEDQVLDDPVMARKFLSTMQKHGLRLSALIEDMLSVSKLESGEAGLLDLSDFKIQEVFDYILERLTPLALEHGSKLKIELPDSTLTLHADRFYWEQILFNLTENAIKQNPHHSIKLTLRAERVNEDIVITVTDTGKGIPANHLPYIFNRFYRAQKHHSQNEIKGTGLGLAIVKHAVEAHGGNVSVTSTPGQVTMFKIVLPQESKI